MPRTVCPVSREEWDSTQPVLITSIDGNENILQPTNFGSGGFGWKQQETMEVNINGRLVKVWVKTIISVVGSQEAL